MSIEKVKEYFRAYGMETRVLEFSVSSATVELAAEALHCTAGEIAKTLSFAMEEGPLLIVVAGDARIDNRKFKEHFGKKATMLPREDVERLVGHAAGGVCPFAVPDGVRVCLDASLRRFATVYPACGNSASAIGLSIPELERYAAGSEWVDVCKLPEA